MIQPTGQNGDGIEDTSSPGGFSLPAEWNLASLGSAVESPSVHPVITELKEARTASQMESAAMRLSNLGSSSLSIAQDFIAEFVRTSPGVARVIERFVQEMINNMPPEMASHFEQYIAELKNGPESNGRTRWKGAVLSRMFNRAADRRNGVV